MTSKEFYADFFGVKNPNEQGTTLNMSVWKYAEAYAKAQLQGQKLPTAIVGETFTAEQVGDMLAKKFGTIEEAIHYFDKIK